MSYDFYLQIKNKKVVAIFGDACMKSY